MLADVQWTELQQSGTYVGGCTVGRIKAISTTTCVQKNGINVGGCEMGRVRAVHTKCGVPQNDLWCHALDSPTHGTTRVTTHICYSIAATTPDLTIEILNSVF